MKVEGAITGQASAFVVILWECRVPNRRQRDGDRSEIARHESAFEPEARALEGLLASREGGAREHHARNRGDHRTGDPDLQIADQQNKIFSRMTFVRIRCPLSRIDPQSLKIWASNKFTIRDPEWIGSGPLRRG